MKENKLIEDFNTFTNAKKQEAIRSKLILLFALLVVFGSLIFAFCVISKRDIVVIERSGEYLKISTESSEKLFYTLIHTTCANLTHYANSFDRLSIQENQAKALFYCDKQDLQRVFSVYNQQKAYHEAIELGAVYTCELEKFEGIKGKDEPYSVSFTSVLTIISGNTKTKFRIQSQGTIIKTTPRPPENITGFFFNSYQQNITKIVEDE